MSTSGKLPLLLGACLFAAIAVADAGDDFTDNLLTDLAPILALFGEKVTMQFMSQATGWADSIILAMAPLGIITIIVAAIRVGGPFWLRSIVGRARENRAVPEAELMSSTSNEVCELWNGQEIVRVMGQGPIREFIILTPEGEPQDKPDDGGDLMLEVKAMELKAPDMMEKGYLEPCEPNLRERVTGKLFDRPDPENGNLEGSRSIDIIRNTMVDVPNLALNIHNQVSRAGLYFAAAAGTILQVSVLAWAGVATYHLKYFKDDKEEEPVAHYAFVCMTVGTSILTLGILLCAFVVERGSSEKTYRPAPKKQARVIWLQKQGTVNDQAFKSFALFPSSAQVMLTTSSRKSSQNEKKGKGWRNHAQEHKGHGLGVAMTTEVITVTATLISFGGFIIQFTGLRALHWSVAVAQLLAIMIMAALRAWVRRNFNKNPEAVPLTAGYELDWLAMTLEKYRTAPWFSSRPDEDCSQLDESSRPWAKGDDSWDWRVMAVQKPNNMKMDLDGPKPESRPHRLMRIRRELGKLAGWAGVASAEAISLARAIEFTMDTFFSDGPRVLNNARSKRRSSGSSGSFEEPRDIWWSLTVSGAPVHFRLSWKAGHWIAYSDELDSVLSLWLYSAHEKEQRTHTKEGESEFSQQKTKEKDGSKNSDQWLRDKGTSQKPSLQILGTHTAALYQDLKWWVPDGVGRVVQIRHSDPNSPEDTSTRWVNAHRVVGFADSVVDPPLTDLDMVCYERHTPKSSDNQDQDQDAALGIESFRPLEQLYALHIFSTFMWAVVNTMKEPIEDRVDVRPVQGSSTGENLAWQNITLRSANLSKFAQGIEATGLGNQEEAFLSIIPALSAQNKLPRIDSIIEWTREHAIRHERLGQWKEAVSAYIWLYQTTRTNTQRHVTVKAIALLMECVKEIGDIIEIRKRQLFDMKDIKNLIQVKDKASDRLRQGVDTKILTAILRLFKMQGREWRQPIIEYEGDLTRQDGDFLKLTRAHYYAHRLTIDPSIGERDFYIKDILDWTALHYVAANNSARVFSHQQYFSRNANVRDIRGRTPLHYLCRFPDSSNIQTLLRQGADINIQDSDGRAPMHVAAMHGHDSVVQYLIEGGANVDVVDSMGHTPLFWAVYKGRCTVVSLLWEISRTNMRDINGRTLLHLAVVADAEEDARKQVVEVLLEKDVALEIQDRHIGTALHFAVMTGHRTTVEQLLGKGALVEAKNWTWQTALHLAAKAGHAHLVELLVNLGADPEAKDSKGLTPLHFAVSKAGAEEMELRLGEMSIDGYGQVAAALLDARVNINAADYGGNTTLHWAIWGGDESLVKLLIQNSADINAKGLFGQTPLWRAAAEPQGHTLVDILLSHKVDVASPDGDGQTPLHAAAQWGSELSAQSLLKKGADVNAKDARGRTPLMGAAVSPNPAMLDLLIGEGADVNVKDQGGWTPLHFATLRGHEQAMRVLLEHGADANAADESERMPLHIAVISRRGGIEKIRLLMMNGADLEAKDAKGRTPMEVALEDGNQLMADFLSSQHGTVRSGTSEGGHGKSIQD
ncbi:ankyrin repeat-containing domain protein [Cercophora samala]|uniref:Ankyrin repeat-containing domain protein n=1 Tax=Cercophora samala TaxID=330535 RepID=A0AA40DBQ6_9PEZI|nr:ankyrin repeat-containing domain protein [Cercophora samala]